MHASFLQKVSFFWNCPLASQVNCSLGQSCSSTCLIPSKSKGINLEKPFSFFNSLHRSPIQQDSVLQAVSCSAPHTRLRAVDWIKLYHGAMCSSLGRLACLLVHNASTSPPGLKLSYRYGLFCHARCTYLFHRKPAMRRSETCLRACCWPPDTLQTAQLRLGCFAKLVCIAWLYRHSRWNLLLPSVSFSLSLPPLPRNTIY